MDELDDLKQDEQEENTPEEENFSGDEDAAPVESLESDPSPVEEVGAEEAQDLPEEGASDRAWYVVHCYSGYENKVRYPLRKRSKCAMENAALLSVMSSLDTCW